MKTSLLKAASLVVPNEKILVNMVSQRVRRLSFGARPLVTVEPGMGAADVALTEIIAGHLTYEAVPHEEWKKLRVINFVRPAFPERAAA